MEKKRIQRNLAFLVALLLVAQESVLPIYALSRAAHPADSIVSVAEDGTDASVQEGAELDGIVESTQPETETSEGEDDTNGQTNAETPEGEDDTQGQTNAETPEGEGNTNGQTGAETPEGENSTEGQTDAETPEGQTGAETTEGEGGTQGQPDIQTPEAEGNTESQPETTNPQQRPEDAVPVKGEVRQLAQAEEFQFGRQIWVEGITPPDHFVADTVESVGGGTHITYKAVYEPGNGWYDTNKRYGGSGSADDTFLCFAVATSNAIHWWMDQNEAYIDDYIAAKPEDVRRKALQELRRKPMNHHDSAVYDQFAQQFGGRPVGYWPDLLADQFINGYMPKRDGDVDRQNDESDRRKLQLEGLSPHFTTIGYFYDALGSIRVTDRRYYTQYARLSRELEELITSQSIVLLNYSTTGSRTHVVTVWGAEYDENDKLKAIYITDSDDPDDRPDYDSTGAPYAMIRLNVKEDAYGNALISTNPDGPDGSTLSAIQIVSLGQEIWQARQAQHPDDPQETIQVTLGNTQFTYTGNPQMPNASSSDIAPYDDVGIFVKGETEVGTYTPSVELKGISAPRYTVDQSNLPQFTIKQAKPTITLTADYQPGAENKAVIFEVSVKGVKKEGLSGTIRLENGYAETLSDEIEIRDGYLRYETDTIPSGYHRVKAIFTPAQEGVSKNYLSGMTNRGWVSIDINDKKPQSIRLEQVPNQQFDPDIPTVFELKLTDPGQGQGEVRYTCNQPGIVSIQGNRATVIGAGTVQITATKAADTEFDSASDTITVQVAKAKAPTLVFPQAGALTYGQSLSESRLTGGSQQYGSFAWVEGGTIPTPANAGYPVQFTASPETLRNYEPITLDTAVVQVTVNKAAPKITLQSEIVNKDGVRKAVLTATVVKQGQGADVTGTVSFANQDTQITLGKPIPLVNGTAVYTWNEVPEGLHKIEAIYRGDANYAAATSQEVILDFRKDPDGNGGDSGNNGGDSGNNGGDSGNNGGGSGNNGGGSGNNGGGSGNNGWDSDNDNDDSGSSGGSSGGNHRPSRPSRPQSRPHKPSKDEVIQIPTTMPTPEQVDEPVYSAVKPTAPMAPVQQTTPAQAKQKEKVEQTRTKKLRRFRKLMDSIPQKTKTKQA